MPVKGTLQVCCTTESRCSLCHLSVRRFCHSGHLSGITRHLRGGWRGGAMIFPSVRGPTVWPPRGPSTVGAIAPPPPPTHTSLTASATGTRVIRRRS